MKNFFVYLFSYPKSIIVFFLSIALLSILIATNFLRIETSTDALINPDLGFKLNQKEIKKEFKILNNNILIKISGENSDILNLKAIEIINRLEKRSDISFIYSPSIDPFFKENFFSFLNDSEKQNLINKLYNYQPFLSEINSNPRLEGFNNILELFLKKDDLNNSNDIFKIIEYFLVSLETNSKVNWFKLLNPNNLNEIFIVLGFKGEYSKKFDSFYKFLLDLTNESDEIRIQYTGGLIIDYEEVISVSNGAAIAGLLSLFFVSIILWIYFKNLYVIFILVASIVIGLIITIGFGTIFVGRLNLISVAFAVLFIGLSVDYGIQIFSRFNEKKIIDQNFLIKNINSLSSTLILASIPSMIGFLSFTFTDYYGLSELGQISFLGLVIGLITNLLFLPSLFLVFRKNVELEKRRNIFYINSVNFIIEKKKKIFFFISLIVFLDIVFIEKIDFDYDALNLKDQKLNSVKLAKELIEKNPTSDYVISSIIQKDEYINSSKISNLISKKSIRSTFSFFDLEKNYENEEFDYLKFLINSQKSDIFHSKPKEFKRFEKLLIDLREKKDGSTEKIDLLLDKIEKANSSKNNFFQIEKLFFFGFDELINKIIMFGDIKEDFLEKLPEYYRDRYISKNLRYRLEIFPENDVSIKSNLTEFVKDVLEVFPNASGMPIIQQKAGEIVVESFMKALLISLLFLVFFLYFIFRNMYFVLISLGSLIIATFLTIFCMIIFNIKLNFANMIALPLLYSLGVSFSVYFIKRFLEFEMDLSKVIRSGTPNAIIISALTTVASFSTLAVSSHNGTSSMGILLFISLSMTILSSIYFTPLMLRGLKKDSSRRNKF